MRTSRRRLKPAYNFTPGDSRVLLHEGAVEISINGNTYNGNGKAYLELIPSATIVLYGDIPHVSSDHAFRLLTNDQTMLSFQGCPIKGYCANVEHDLISQRCVIKWRPESEPINCIGHENTLITQVVFHIFNFVDFFWIRSTKGQYKAVRNLNLKSNGWKVKITSLPTTHDNFKRLRKEGGFQLTHIGHLERVDGSTFTGREAQEYLDAVRYFLSFAKGGWCEPNCAVGYDATGSRVWEAWTSPREAWRQPNSWFDPHHGEQLVALFPGFMSRWADEEWRNALREVIYWYLNSNHNERGIDAGIILTQAAIERCSFEYVVKERQLIESNGFKDIKASDKYRLLFSSLGIPLGIPNILSAITKLAKSRSWIDNPHAMTEVRNSLVHPDHKLRSQSKGTSVIFEAWSLGQWYLELAILCICGYSGTYGNRLDLQRWTGQVEDVPWKA